MIQFIYIYIQVCICYSYVNILIISCKLWIWLCCCCSRESGGRRLCGRLAFGARNAHHRDRTHQGQQTGHWLALRHPHRLLTGISHIPFLCVHAFVRSFAFTHSRSLLLGAAWWSFSPSSLRCWYLCCSHSDCCSLSPPLFLMPL